MEITGIIQWCGDLQAGTTKDGKQWSSREFVIEETKGRVPRDRFKFVVSGDLLAKCNFNVSDEVRLTYGISCRVYDKKDGSQDFFNTIRAYDAQRLTMRVPVNANNSPELYGGDNYMGDTEDVI